MTYTPGKPLILQRLPAQDWFTVEEAAAASGWSRSFINQRIRTGVIPAQSYLCPCDGRQPNGRQSYRVHVDDLVLFILLNGQGRYDEKKSFGDVIAVLRNWPLWMLRELHKALGRIIDSRTAPLTAARAKSASLN